MNLLGNRHVNLLMTFTIVDPGGAQTLYDKASSKDKTIRIYEGLYHEVFNEPERAGVLKEVETWLAAHV